MDFDYNNIDFLKQLLEEEPDIENKLLTLKKEIQKQIEKENKQKLIENLKNALQELENLEKQLKENMPKILNNSKDKFKNTKEEKKLREETRKYFEEIRKERKIWLGKYGEQLNEQKLQQQNIQGYYKTIRNIYVPYENGTTEIDIVMIHEKGIFVFESKNYSGWIFGGTNNKKWTQMINKNSKYQFYNPILQNQTHINILSKSIKLYEYRFKSYIVFSERCKLMKVPIDTKQYKILKRNDMIQELRKDLESRQNMFTQKQVNYIYDKLKQYSNVQDNVKEEHINSINKRYKED